MFFKPHAAALAAAFIGLSLGQVSANTVTTINDLSAAYSSAGQSVSNSIASGNIVPYVPFQDTYFFTPTVNSVLSASTVTITDGVLVGFSLATFGPGSSTPIASAAEPINPGLGLSLSFAPTTLSLSDTSDVLLAGQTYSFAVYGDAFSPTASYSGDFQLAAATPLPATLPFFAMGLAGLWGWRKKGSQTAAA